MPLAAAAIIILSVLLKPFQAVRYSLNKVNIAAVVSPPYDVIDSKLQQQLYTQSPYNIVRLILGQSYAGDTATNNRYTRAADFLSSWQKEGILQTDNKPSLYLYQMQYQLHGEVKTVNGLLGLVKLEPFGHSIHPHEKTLAAPKTDRLELMRACQANFCPIYAVYEDKDSSVAAILSTLTKNKPLLTVTQDTAKNSSWVINNEATPSALHPLPSTLIKHSLWTVNDETTIKNLANLFQNKELLIADGHHRYETALSYQKEKRAQDSPSSEQPYDYVLMFLAPMTEKDLTVLPTHRLIKKSISETKLLPLLKANFNLTPLSSASETIKALNQKTDNLVFGLALREKFFLLEGEKHSLSQKIQSNHSQAWKSLDTAILNELILKDLALRPNKTLFFSEDTTAVLKEVEDGKATCAFILRPLSLSQIMQVARAGEKMPQKSTYFYPKPLTGLVIYKFNESFKQS